MVLRGLPLHQELDRLDRLRERRLAALSARLAHRDDTRSQQELRRQTRAANALFTDYRAWISEAMTTADQPFVQVVAVLTGEG